MAMRERLVYAIDVVTDGAQKGLKGFRQSVADADGATGKFKAGASSAFETVKANAGALALGAGAALVTFGAKAVAAFQETALEAGKFSDATGLAVEDASRWIEVAGDVGVSAETMQGAFVRLNKALATGGGAVEKYGLSLVTAADGTADVNQTMLDTIAVISGIKDPTERAKAAQELFGRSYAEAAEIIFDSASNVKGKLDEVSEAKVIDEGELEKARRFRETMDNLQDSLQDISIVVGELLVPQLTEAADALLDVKRIADKLDFLKYADDAAKFANPIKVIGDELKGPVVDGAKAAGDAIKGAFGSGGETEQAVSGGMAQFTSGLDNIVERTRDYSDALAALEPEQRRSIEAMQGDAEAAQAAADATEEKAAWDERAAEAADVHREAVEAVADALEAQQDAALELVGGDIAVRDAQRDAAEAAAELNDILADQETTLGEAGAAIDTAAEAQLDAASAAAEYRAQQLEANGQAVDAQTKAFLLKDELSKLAANLTGPLKDAILGYIADLDAIPKTVGTTIVLNKPGRVGDFAPTLGPGRHFDSGGVVPGPRGSEQLIMAHGGETVLPTHKPNSGGNGGGNYQVTFVVQQVLTPQQVVDAIKKHERFAGPGWRS